jgi:hypothetical protein
VQEDGLLNGLNSSRKAACRSISTLAGLRQALSVSFVVAVIATMPIVRACVVVHVLVEFVVFLMM